MDDFFDFNVDMLDSMMKDQGKNGMDSMMNGQIGMGGMMNGQDQMGGMNGMMKDDNDMSAGGMMSTIMDELKEMFGMDGSSMGGKTSEAFAFLFCLLFKLAYSKNLDLMGLNIL